MNPVGSTSVNSYAKQSVASKQASIAQEETSASPLKVEHNKVTLSTEGKALLFSSHFLVVQTLLVLILGQIWSQFWEFANDREKAASKGIRAADGEAVSIKTQPGKTYRIVLRASDGLSISPDNAPPKSST